MNWRKEAPKSDGWYFWRRSAKHGMEHWQPVRVQLDYVGYHNDMPRGGWWLGPVEDYKPSPRNPFGRLK